MYRAEAVLRVLRISHSATLPSYRARERSLVQTGAVQLALVKPQQWRHLGHGESDCAEPFSLVSSAVLGEGSIPLFVYDPRPIVSVLKTFQPQVVDIHEEPYSIAGFECALLARKYAPQAACLFYSAQNIKKAYPAPFSWTERFVYNYADAAYPCSKSVQETLVAKGFTKPSPVIPLAVDPARFLDRGDTLALPSAFNSRFIIGYTGRLEECKGVQVLLRALAQLHKTSDMPLPAVLIAGSGAYRGALQQLASELGVAQSIAWLGELPADKMPQFYRSCDAVVIPSLTTATWREQFGRAVIEAMSCRTAVVCSDSGSLLEVAADAALVVPEDDEQALAQALANLAGSNDLRSALIYKGTVRVQNNYTWERIAAQMIELYRSVLRTRAGAAPQRQTAGALQN